jgi:hypothetical protein
MWLRVMIADMYPGTSAAFKRIAKIESALKKTAHVRAYKGVYFNTEPVDYKVEDDHVPFLSRKVCVATCAVMCKSALLCVPTCT